MTAAPAPPYWRLSGFYLCYFATLGALIPYWGLYLRAHGYTPAAIGELMAVLMATKIAAPNVWAWVADRRERRMGIVRAASLLSLLAFAGVFIASGFWWLALVMLGFSFFWNASLPQFEAVTLGCLGAHPHRYGRIRLWGSVGFIISVVTLGALLDRFGTGLLPAALAMLFAAIWLLSLLVPNDMAARHRPASESLRSVLRRPTVAALLVTCLLMQASHGPYYAFYTLYLSDHGYAPGLIGQLWALGVVAEIGIFLLMPRLLPACGARRLLLASLALAAVRWLLIGVFVDQLPLLLVAQVLHAATFGIYHAAAIHLIHRHFPGRLQGRGQALYSSVSFGVGGALGSLSAGWLWGGVGPVVVYALASAVAILGLVAAVLWVRDTPPAAIATVEPAG